MEVLVILGAVASAIFWMVVGWRAMLAHERLARAADHLARRLHFEAQPILRGDDEEI
jgi:hypothetical protein